MPLVLCRPGKRPHNQDFTIPRESEKAHQLPIYLVCDGVGGQPGGEIAAKIVAESLETWYNSHPNQKRSSFFAKQGVLQAELELAAFAKEQPKYGLMSTTLVLASPLPDGGVLLGWAGDSVALHLRHGEIEYQTRDHSVVNQLLDEGAITKAEAETHPRRNVITNCLSAGWKTAQLATHKLEDLRPGDTIVLCSDGLLEAITPAELATKTQPIFFTDPLALADQIAERCEAHSYDNYSMILLTVE